jgi:hypothetical protein
MEKVACPHCKSQVFKTPRCSKCGKDLFETAATADRARELEARQQAGDEFGFVARAWEAHVQQSNAELLRVRATDQLPNGLSPHIKKLVVPPGTSTMIVSEIHEPRLLEAGEYDVSRLGLGGGLLASLEAGGAWTTRC